MGQTAEIFREVESAGLWDLLDVKGEIRGTGL